MPHAPDDLYALLGLDAQADVTQIRRLWRVLARKWHPDYAGPGATATFQRFSAAYAVLSDPAARAAYDRQRKLGSGEPLPRTRSAPSAPPAGSTRPRTPSTMISRLTGPLNALIACGFARQLDPSLIELILTPKEAAEGGMVKISMWVKVQKTERIADELFSAWLAVFPTISDGTLLSPSALLPGMIHRVRFRIKIQS